MSLFRLGVIQEQYNKRILDYQHKIDVLREEFGLSSPDNDARSPKKTRRNRQDEGTEFIKDNSSNTERDNVDIDGTHHHTSNDDIGEAEEPEAHPDSFNSVASDEIDMTFENNGCSGEDEEYDYNEDDEESVIEEAGQFHKSKISQSTLHMAVQGFQMQDQNIISRDRRGQSPTAADKVNRVVFDPESVEFKGTVLHKNKCYTLKGIIDIIVGIQRFISMDTALCVLVTRFRHTILGEQGVELNDHTHVQVFRCTKEIALADLDSESAEVRDIPHLIYQAQTPGKWHSFGYFYDRNKVKRSGRREKIRSLELFAGAGGSLQG
jgi:hypothetical protein